MLLCFPKIFERIIHNRWYQYLTENKVLYSKQFDFQMGHLTERAMVQLTDQILESFECNKCTLGVFIDLSNAFNTVDHSVFLKNWNYIV